MPESFEEAMASYTAASDEVLAQLDAALNRVEHELCPRYLAIAREHHASPDFARYHVGFGPAFPFPGSDRGLLNSILGKWWRLWVEMGGGRKSEAGNAMRFIAKKRRERYVSNPANPKTGNKISNSRGPWPIHLLADGGETQLADIKSAAVVIAVDVMTRRQIVIFGRDEVLGDATGLDVVWFDLDADSEELGFLCEIVERIKGHHEYDATDRGETAGS